MNKLNYVKCKFYIILGNILDLVDTTSGNIFLVLRDVLSSCNSDSLLSALTQYQYLIVKLPIKF